MYKIETLNTGFIICFNIFYKLLVLYEKKVEIKTKKKKKCHIQTTLQATFVIIIHRLLLLLLLLLLFQFIDQFLELCILLLELLLCII